MEGPRAARKEELGSLRELTDAVFRPSMMDEYPQLFNAENLENLTVCVEDGRCISHVGMTEPFATLFGCPIRVACIGAVSTLKEHRGRGCASACFDHAVEKAHRDGVDFMLVSGDRNLYRMRGCLKVGRETSYSLTTDDGPRTTVGVEVSVEPMQGEELALVMECYRREPVRFLRSPIDYEYALHSGVVMNRLAGFLVIRERGDFRGYVIVQKPGENRKSRLAEFAGDRRAILAALPAVMRHYDLTGLSWQAQGHDTLFCSLCDAAGISGTPVPAAGTLKLINFAQLMERMRPRWRELLGARDASRLSFYQNGERYAFRFDEHELITDRDTATRLLFGSIDGAASAAVANHGELTDVLRTILPLPCLWYGLNYV